MTIHAMAAHFHAYGDVHAGTFRIFLRILAYCLMLFGSGWVSSTYFAGSYLGEVSVFCLCSSVFELAWAGTTDSRRFAAYLVVLVLLVFSGGYLSQLMASQSQHAPKSTPTAKP